MNIPNLFKYVPLAAAAALALAVSPLQAHPGGGGGGGGHFGGGGRGGGGHMSFHGGGGGGHASFHGGGGHASFHGGGGHVAFHGGVVHGGGRFVHRGPAFRGRGFGPGPFWGVGVWPYYGGYYDYGYAPDGYYDDSGPAYSAGSVDTTATAVQQALANDGYYTGPIDGIIGSGTTGAIAAYQRDHGLPVTGSINAQLLSSLGMN
jgi:hypothetical protein